MGDSRATQYIHGQIGSTGWVLLSSRWATVICPELYGHGQRTFALEGQAADRYAAKLGLQPYLVRFDDGSESKCWSRSPANLAMRIEWLTGLAAQVTPLNQVATAQPAPIAAAYDQRAQSLQAKMQRLRDTAAQDLPEHDCPRRGEILAARHELESLEAL